MTTAIFPGSFDPWSLGHQFIFNAALQIFDCIHIVIASNPSKTGKLSLSLRSVVVANILAPLQEWSALKEPFTINYQGKKIVILHVDGLIVDYAREQNINILIRGLRSTSDFESEFGLYFSNHALYPELQTWTVMCPPELLHFSSTYVRAVAGHPHALHVGTSFLAQSLLLERSAAIGKIYDLIDFYSHSQFSLQQSFSKILSLLPKDQDKLLDRSLGLKILDFKQKITTPESDLLSDSDPKIPLYLMELLTISLEELGLSSILREWISSIPTVILSPRHSNLISP